jgi:hypothetical protein
MNMGTRSLTVMLDEDDKEIAVLYRQFDGYPEGHGKDLKDFLKPITLVNGISMAETRPIANGAACLAAQIVAHFKTPDRVDATNSAGNFYLYPAGTRDAGEEYIYTVHTKGGKIRVIMKEV